MTTGTTTGTTTEATSNARASTSADAIRHQSPHEQPDPCDVFTANCSSRRLLDTIGNKWVSLTIIALGEHGPLRYSQVFARIEGVSQKMLTQTLRRMERDGLVTRTVTPSVPLRTDYELTPLGASLIPVLRSLKNWAEAHMGEVYAAREAFDAARS